MPSKTTRRDFLKRSTCTTASFAVASSLGSLHASAPKRKSKKLRLGLIGCGSIMRYHIRATLTKRKDISIAWLCDVDPKQLELAKKLISKSSSMSPKQTSKYEAVFKDSNVDACIIATPHHWHAPLAIRAMQAGKHVYLEKPISHTFSEGPLLIDAAKKYKRVLQQGSQMRSSPVTEKAGKLLRAGMIGEVKVARAWSAELRRVIKPVPNTPAPKGVDYNRWLGPAPTHEFNSNRFHKTWRLFRDYGNGVIGDDGIHDLDMAAWGLNIDTLPKKITARGGTMFLKGHVSEYPDNRQVVYEYPDGRIIMYENYPFPRYGMHGYDNGNVFYGTKGYMVFSRRGAFNVYLGPKSKPGPTEGKELRGNRGYSEHFDNFLKAIREASPLSAPADVAHNSCALVHLGDITSRVKGALEFDSTSGKFIDCDEANKLLSKEYRKPFGI